MWLWIWACVGRTFIPDIFFTPMHFSVKTPPQKKKKQTPSHKHENTTTPPPHKHHQTDATTKTQLHNTTPRTTHTPTHTYTGTQKLSNPCEAVWFHMYLHDNMWRSHRKGHRSRSTIVRRDQLKKKSFHFTEGHSSRMPFFTCRSKQVCRARHGHLICRQNLQLIRKV